MADDPCSSVSEEAAFPRRPMETNLTPEWDYEVDRTPVISAENP